MMYERLQNVAFPASCGKNVFAFSFREKFTEDGWAVYDAEAELRRLVSVWVCTWVCVSGEVRTCMTVPCLHYHTI